MEKSLSARVKAVSMLHPPISVGSCAWSHARSRSAWGEASALLNREFFAPGQAYVALTRVTTLRQLHPFPGVSRERVCDLSDPVAVRRGVRMTDRYVEPIERCRCRSRRNE